MKPSRLVLAIAGSAAFAVVGCNLVLGIKGDYTTEDDGSEGGVLDDGGHLVPDATVMEGGGEAGPGMDASTSDVREEPVPDAGPALCSDGAVSPQSASIGDPCCASSALACLAGNKLEQIICVNGFWAPNGACTGTGLCRTDLGAYPDGGAENGGTIVGGGSANGSLGTCAAEIPSCTGKQPGDVFCGGTSASVLFVCGADLTTAYSETCGSADLCKHHIGPHCVQCIDGMDFLCNGSAPASCSDGGYVQKSACEAGTYCHADDGTCATDVCKPGTFACTGDNLEACDAVGDNYLEAGACEAGTCDKGAGVCDFCLKSTTYGCNDAATSYSACAADGTQINTTNCGAPTPYCFEPAGGTNASCVQCLSVANCPAPNACQSAACASGSCSLTKMKNGTIVTPPAPGACTETTCMDGTPTVTSLPDGTVLVMPDGTSCTETTCTGGVAGPASAPAGTACMVLTLPGTCDATGNCMVP